jgi:DNA topoisomerase-1
MEKAGIGRPSTYANTIEILIDRKYVEKKNINGKKIDTKNYILEKNNIKEKIETITHGAEKKKIVPTQLGLLTIEFLNKHFENILNTDFTSQLEEKLDNIVNHSILWNNVVKEFYEDFEPSFLKLNNKDEIIKNNNDKKRFLGVNEQGKNVYAYIGKYGPVIQIGENKDCKYIKLEDEYNINDVKLEDLNKIKKYPMNIGIYKDHEIIIKKGIYGLYINYNDKNIKILENIDAENISLEEAISCIENTGIDNDLIKKLGDYVIKNGKYGPYILFKKKFYPIPKSYNPNDIDENIIKEIISKKILKSKK